MSRPCDDCVRVKQINVENCPFRDECEWLHYYEQGKLDTMRGMQAFFANGCGRVNDGTTVVVSARNMAETIAKFLAEKEQSNE